MSRGFVKEEDQEEIPMVPPRAHLPDGVINYVTKAGYKALTLEKEQLNDEKEAKFENDKEKRIAINFINAKLQLLETRIATAEIINLKEQPKDEVRFGASVSFKINNSSEIKTYQIVGVDEADLQKNKISFLSPVAKLLIEKKMGDIAELKLEKGSRNFEIIGIDYI